MKYHSYDDISQFKMWLVAFPIHLNFYVSSTQAPQPLSIKHSLTRTGKRKRKTKGKRENKKEKGEKSCDLVRSTSATTLMNVIRKNVARNMRCLENKLQLFNPISSHDFFLSLINVVQFMIPKNVHFGWPQCDWNFGNYYWRQKNLDVQILPNEGYKVVEW